MKPRISRTPPAHIPRQREGMDPGHLANIRRCHCVIEGDRLLPKPIVAHHLLRSGEHGTGRKSSDRWAIPLSSTVHDALHARGDEEAYLAEQGIDGRALANALWSKRGDLDAMQRIVFRFWQAGEQYRRAR